MLTRSSSENKVRCETPPGCFVRQKERLIRGLLGWSSLALTWPVHKTGSKVLQHRARLTCRHMQSCSVQRCLYPGCEGTGRGEARTLSFPWR